MFRWNEQSIAWMENAAAQSDYHRSLAGIIGAVLPSNAHILDVGCGIGHLSKALCAQGFAVTALDYAPIAVQHLAAQNVPHLQVICADAFAYVPPVVYDGAVFCFFGDADTILDFYHRGYAKKLFIIGAADQRRMFSLHHSQRRRRTLDILCTRLDQLHIPYIRTCFSLSFGQPFRSLQDAEDFFSFYNQGERVTENPAWMQKLVFRQNHPFPYYYPAEKPLCMVTLEHNRKDV